MSETKPKYIMTVTPNRYDCATTPPQILETNFFSLIMVDKDYADNLAAELGLAGVQLDLLADPVVGLGAKKVRDLFAASLV